MSWNDNGARADTESNPDRWDQKIGSEHVNRRRQIRRVRSLRSATCSSGHLAASSCWDISDVAYGQSSCRTSYRTLGWAATYGVWSAPHRGRLRDRDLHRGEPDEPPHVASIPSTGAFSLACAIRNASSRNNVNSGRGLTKNQPRSARTPSTTAKTKTPTCIPSTSHQPQPDPRSRNAMAARSLSAPIAYTSIATPICSTPSTAPPPTPPLR